MKNLILILFSLIIISANAQEKKIVGSFVFNEKIHGYEFIEKDPKTKIYSLTISKFKTNAKIVNEKNNELSGNQVNKDNTEIVKKISSQQEENLLKSESKTLQNVAGLSIETYEKAIKELIEGLWVGDLDLNSVQEKELDYVAKNLFFEIKTRIEFIDQQPKTGALFLQSSKINVYQSIIEPDYKLRLKQQNFKDTIITELNINELQIQFSEGTINNLQLFTTDPEDANIINRIKFRNNTPISISSKFDPESFGYIRIYYDQTSASKAFESEIIREIKINETKTILGSTPYVKLNEFLRYDILFANKNEDYSPSDTVLTLTPDFFIKEVYKEKTSKVLTARTFSDLAGINENQPNGLIQIEVFRRLNLVTENRQSSNSGYFEALRYFTPKFSINKIEENERYLQIQDKTDNIKDSTNAVIIRELTVSPIDLVKHRQFELSGDLNLIAYNIPKVKFFLDLNYSLSQATFSYKETEDSEILSPVYFSTYGALGYIQFLTDSRFGLKIGYDVKKQLLHNKEISGSNESIITINENKINWYGAGWLLANLKTSDNSEIFFRSRYSQLFGDTSANFWEIQIGYSFDIIKK